MKIHMLQCGCIRVDPTVPFVKRLDLIEAAKQLTATDKNRITLPVFTYLIEHPKGLLLVDTGWCREVPGACTTPRRQPRFSRRKWQRSFIPLYRRGWRSASSWQTWAFSRRIWTMCC